MSIARVGAAYQACRHSDEAAVAGGADARNTVWGDYAITFAGIVKILALGLLHTFYSAYGDGVFLNGDGGTLEHSVQYACRQILPGNLLVSNKEASVEGIFLFAIVSVGDVCILVILYYHIVYVLAFCFHGFETPKQVVGIMSASCPCCDEIRTTHFEISTSIGAVHRFAEIIVTVLANVECFADG